MRRVTRSIWVSCIGIAVEERRGNMIQNILIPSHESSPDKWLESLLHQSKRSSYRGLAQWCKDHWYGTPVRFYRRQDQHPIVIWKKPTTVDVKTLPASVKMLLPTTNWYLMLKTPSFRLKHNEMKSNLKLIILFSCFILSVSFCWGNPNFYIYLCFGQSNMEGAAKIEGDDTIINSRLKLLSALIVPIWVVSRVNGTMPKPPALPL